MKDRTLFFIALLAVWIGAILITHPHGEFPLNDDWSYSRTTQRFLEKGELQFPGEVAVPMLTHLLWGGLFTKIFGFSFTALRISTLILGGLGLFFLFAILLEAGVSSGWAFFGTFLIAFNPLYFQLSNSYMTDIPFAVWGLASFLFFLRSVRSDSKRDFFLGTGFATAAVLTRQIAVIIPLSYGLAYLIWEKRSIRNTMKAFLPAFLAIVLLLIYQTSLQILGRLPVAYNCHVSFIINNYSLGFMKFNFNRITWNFLCLWPYVGIFLLPLLIAIFPKITRSLSSQEQKKVWWMVTWVSIVWLLLLARAWGRGLMPLTPNLLDAYGFGPIILWNSWQYLHRIPRVVRILLTLISVTSASFLIWYFSFLTQAFLKTFDKKNQTQFCLLFASFAFIIYGISLLPIDGLDRYYLLLTILGTIIILTGTQLFFSFFSSRLFIFAAILTFVSFAAFSVAGVHDYLALHRARWKAGTNLLIKEKLLPDQINGGFEFNAWYSYPLTKRFRSEDSWWWVKNMTNDYALSLGPIKGYRQVARYPFQRWLPYKEDQILVLKKAAA